MSNDPPFNEKLLEEIIRVLPDEFPHDKKQDFAWFLSDDFNVFNAIDEAKDDSKYLTHYKDVSATARSLELRLKKYRSAIYGARRQFKSITPLSNFLGDEFHAECDLQYLIKYFERYNKALAKIKPKGGYAGRQNKAGRKVCLLIAREYLSRFKCGLYTNKDDPSPYDQVCNAVEKFYEVKLSHDIRADVVSSIKSKKN